MVDNVLYCGDNLGILRRYIKGESVDFIYLDPPSSSKATHSAWPAMAVSIAVQNEGRHSNQVLRARLLVHSKLA